MKEITVDNYFEDDEYMSVSTWKKYNKCEVGGKMGVYNMTPTPSMLVGSYVDAYVEGTLEQFVEEHPEIISSRGVTKGELKSEFKLADEICKFIDSDEVFSQFMSGEKQRIMIGEISGVPFKIKMDSYSDGIAINDLKCMRSVTDSKGKYVDFITPWGYDIQMACYQEIVRQNNGKVLPCYICAVTKETPINSVIVQIPQEILDKALYQVSSTIEHYYNVKMEKEEAVGCGCCGTCVSNRKETPIISFAELIGGFMND